MRISDWSSDVCSSDLHWMLLLLEQLFLGRTSWSALLQELEVSPSTLSKRLSQLIDAECLEKVHSGGRAVDYRLTPRGEEIFATLLAGAEWHDGKSVA